MILYLYIEVHTAETQNKKITGRADETVVKIWKINILDHSELKFTKLHKLLFSFSWNNRKFVVNTIY